MIKERPILYSTPMIQAKLAGRKTQTRRIIKESFNGCLTNGGPHPCPNDPVVLIPGTNLGKFMPEDEHETIIDYPQVRAVFHCSTLDSEAMCPFGKVGDVLWSRETFIQAPFGKVHYRADITKEQEDIRIKNLQAGHAWAKWKPSIFQPKGFARIWERITDIRVERLQDISEKDAIAEGVESFKEGNQTLYKHYVSDDVCYSAKDSYASLWESINGDGSWGLNPWCWCITTEILSTTGRPKGLAVSKTETKS